MSELEKQIIVDPATLPPFTRRGKADKPQPLTTDDKVVYLKTCPDCMGRGWFLINPFAQGGANGAGGLANQTQCLTCLDAYAYFNTHGRLPELKSEAAK